MCALTVEKLLGSLPRSERELQLRDTSLCLQGDLSWTDYSLVSFQPYKYTCYILRMHVCVKRSNWKMQQAYTDIPLKVSKHEQQKASFFNDTFDDNSRQIHTSSSSVDQLALRMIRGTGAQRFFFFQLKYECVWESCLQLMGHCYQRRPIFSRRISNYINSSYRHAQPS